MKQALLVAASCAALALACSSNLTPLEGAAGTSAQPAGASGSGGNGGGGEPAAGSGGSARASAGGAPGGTAGSSNVGGASGSAAESGAGTGGGGSSSGGSGPAVPEGVPSDFTLQLDLPFSTPDSLTTALLAANPSAWKIEDGSLSFAGTGYTAPAPVNESLTSFAIVKTLKLSSFVLDVELQQTNPDAAQPHRDLCIVFGASDDRHFYYAHIAATHDERSHNVHLIDNAPRKPLTVTNDGGIAWGPAGTWHAFRLVRDVESGRIAVYADNDLQQPILTASDKTFGSGYVGFGTFQDSGKLRNLKVWAKAAEQADAGSFFGG